MQINITLLKCLVFTSFFVILQPRILLFQYIFIYFFASVMQMQLTSIWNGARIKQVMEASTFDAAKSHTKGTEWPGFFRGFV